MLVTNWYYKVRFCNCKIRDLWTLTYFSYVSSTKGKRGSVLSVVIRQSQGITSSIKCPDRLRGPPSLRFKWALSMAIKRHDVRLTTQLHPVPKVTVSGVICPLPSYAFTVCRGITITCTLLFPHTAIPSAACKAGIPYDKIFARQNRS